MDENGNDWIPVADINEANEDLQEYTFDPVTTTAVRVYDESNINSQMGCGWWVNEIYVFTPGGDGIGDACDNCPSEDASDFDADQNGCLDNVQDLSQVIDTLPDDALSTEIKNSLTSKVAAALNSVDKEKDQAAINQLKAFINEINAQRGKKISEEAADLLIDYANNVILQIQAG